jgi:hypothetical protein
MPPRVDKATARTPTPQGATFAALELQVIAEGSKISWIFIQTPVAAPVIWLARTSPLPRVFTIIPVA